METGTLRGNRIGVCAQTVAPCIGRFGFLLLGACSPLSVLSALSGTHIQQSTRYAYGDAPRQTLAVHLPQDARPNADVVLFLYGGRWQYGSKEEYRFAADGLAQSGFITVIADYRLYPDADWRDFLADSAAAYHWTENHVAGFGGNPRRIFLMGHSAGAHLAAMVALDKKLRQQAGIKRLPCGLIGLAGPYDFLPINDADIKDVFKSANPLIETQPIYYVSSPMPPMLLLTGQDDVAVKPGNTKRMAAAVNKAGGKAQVIEYANVGHVDIMLAMAPILSGLAPTLQDTARFIRETSCP